MNKQAPSESFGIFKPVGHTVITFSAEADLIAAVASLKAQGFVDANLMRYAPRK